MVKVMRGWCRKSEEARDLRSRAERRVHERQCRSAEHGPRATTGDADEEWGETFLESMERDEWAPRAKFDKRVASLTTSMPWLECGLPSVCKQSHVGPIERRGAGRVWLRPDV